MNYKRLTKLILLTLIATITFSSCENEVESNHEISQNSLEELIKLKTIDLENNKLSFSDESN